MVNNQIDVERLIKMISEMHSQNKRLLITLDGPCASGKTTLARTLAEALSAVVVHTDDYVIPHALKTAERLAIPGGNCDVDRLVCEVAAPWKASLPVKYRRYDCMNDCLMPEELLPDTEILIIEGSYCNLPAVRQYADLRLFMDTPFEIRMVRLIRRENKNTLKMFLDKWIPLEYAYFAAYGLPDADCVVIR